MAAVPKAVAVAAPNLNKIHPVLKAIVRNLPRVAAKQGFRVRVTSGYRSRALQTKLYKEFLAGKSIYPVNPPGTSEHEKGLALDILSTNTNLLVSDLAQAGLYWAGPSDPIHFGLTPRPAVAGPRTNDLAPAKVIPWEKMTKAQQLEVLLAGVNKKVMKPW